jgi:putative CocE/NonD family hydrolase
VTTLSEEAVGTSHARQRYEVDVLRDVRIPAEAPGVTLSGDLYLPIDAGPVPALVVAYPYRKDGQEGISTEPNLRWFAERGYAGLFIDFRGLGSSDGKMRPPLDADEADDGVAAVEWAATQPWCSGDVGMWGISYGAIMSMRTACRRPPSLKAIIPMMGSADPALGVVHPHGTRGGSAAIPFWCTHTLSNQLLPSLQGFAEPAEQRRWRHRLDDAQPWLIDFFRHGPRDPVWEERAFDTSAIEVPSLCVAGWWDILREDQIRAYEEMQGPKKLLAGPWMHIMPHDSPVERIDFLSVALRWWDHWLRGIENGVMDEPAVTLYIQGADPGWRGYSSWPPSDGELVLATGTDAVLTDTSEAQAEHSVIAEYRPDATIGTLSGLWAVIPAQFGLPLDQHSDDLRSALATSEPLSDDVVITGRPEVSVDLASDAAPQRIVVRLCEVDSEGTSTLVTSGIAVGSTFVVLDPTTYRFRAGNRVRVAISDSDFPRCWPLSDPEPLAITRVEFVAPTVSEAVGAPASVPPLEAPDPAASPLGLWEVPRWEITRDPLHDGVEVLTGVSFASYTAGREHLLERRKETRASVRRDAPEATVMEASDTQVARLLTGERVEVTVQTRMTLADVWTRGEVTIDGNTIFSRIWDAVAPSPEALAERPSRRASRRASASVERT